MSCQAHQLGRLTLGPPAKQLGVPTRLLPWKQDFNDSLEKHSGGASPFAKWRSGTYLLRAEAVLPFLIKNHGAVQFALRVLIFPDLDTSPVKIETPLPDGHQDGTWVHQQSRVRGRDVVPSPETVLAF